MELVQGYGYFERFYINFSSAPNNEDASDDYRVVLKQRLFIPSAMENPPTPIELDGAPSPFILSLSNVEDVFTPMRAAVARISFVDDIDLGELLPRDAFEWRVELTRLTDDKRIFVGYLTAEVYSQPAISGPNIVTVNAASPMTPISALPMPIANVGSLTIGGLIQMAIKSTIEQDIDTVYIPAIYSLKNNAAVSDYAALLGWQFSTGLFTHFVDDTKNDSNIECDPYTNAFEAVCKLFGWSMVDPGDGSLYFVSPGYSGEYMAFSTDELTLEGATPQLISPQHIDSTIIEPVDKTDMVEYQQGLRAISVTPDVKDATIEVPSFTSRASEWKFTQQSSTVTDAAGTAHEVSVGKIKPNITSAIQFPRYRATVTENDDHTSFGASATWKEVVDGSIDDALDVHAEYRRIDAVLPADLSGGTDAKKAWSFADSIMLNDFVRYKLSYAARWINFIPENLPMVRIKGRIGFVNSGALVVNFSIRATPQDGFSIPEDYVVSGAGETFELGYGQGLTLNDGVTEVPHTTFGIWPNPELTDERVSVKASLRIGNVYWNGVAWEGQFKTFDIPITSATAEWHPVDSNKTIMMPYEGDSGYYAEIYSPRSGDVELCIYTGTSRGVNIGYPLRLEMKDLSLSYIPTLDYVDIENVDSEFYRDLGAGFTEQRDVSLPLHSRINNAEQMSLLFSGNYKVIDKLYRTTSTTAEKPERFLLDEYERVYGRTIRRWRRGMWLRNLSPIDMFTAPGSEDSVLMLSGYTMDFGENTSEMYVTEVRIVKMVKYVN